MAHPNPNSNPYPNANPDPNQVREWRTKRAQNEARVAALRLYAETGSLQEALAELSPTDQAEGFSTGDALTNATLLQFEVPSSLNPNPTPTPNPYPHPHPNPIPNSTQVPSSLNASAVLGELLQELDLDLDEVADVRVRVRVRVRVEGEGEGEGHA